jgi:hypothetical protein
VKPWSVFIVAVLANSAYRQHCSTGVKIGIPMFANFTAKEQATSPLGAWPNEGKYRHYYIAQTTALLD